MQIEIRTLPPYQFSLNSFYQAFLNFTKSLRGKYVNDVGLMIKKDICYAISIREFTSLDVCITFIRVQNQTQSKKSCEVVITSIL